MAAHAVVVIIPALDEEESIGAVVRALPQIASRVIVVDNGSRDRTAEAARAAGAEVVREPRRGYGRACLAGIAAAGGAEVLVFLDGDGSDDPALLPSLVAPIRDGRADLVIGSRSLGRREPGAHPWHAVLGTRLCVGLMNRLAGTRATDLGPFRAISSAALRRLDMRDPDYGWTVEMQVKAAQAGLRTLEVAVDQRRRAAGRSKVSGTVRGTIGAARKILATILRHGLLARAASVPGRPWLLALCACVLSGCVLEWAFGPPPTSRIAQHLLSFGAAFGAYLLALLASPGLSRRLLWAALALAFVWRAVLVAGPPLLSDDVYRYVWEGRVQLHGGNPYRWSDRPEASRWIDLRDRVWHGVNHKGYTAVYPPLFLLASRLVVALHDSVTAMKVFLVACEGLTLGLLGLLLSRRRLPPERLLVLAWSPLSLVEIAGSGHNEAFGMLWLASSLLALEAGWPLASALAGAAGLASKLLPGLVVVAWARRYRFRHLLAAAALAAACAAPFLDAGWAMLTGLRKYSQFWTFNETFFAPLASAFGHGTAVRIAAALALGLALVLGARRTEPVAAATAVVAASLLLGPNVLPWYALWLLPLLTLREEPAALLFTGTVSLAYLVYPSWLSGEPWTLGWGWRTLEYGPCLLVAVLARSRSWPRFGPHESCPPA